MERGADAVLVHHGYFWKGEDPCLTGMKHRRLATLLRHDIGLLAYHLPLDAHPELGNNAQLARMLESDRHRRRRRRRPHARSGDAGRAGFAGQRRGIRRPPRRSSRPATPAHRGQRCADPPTGLVHRRRAVIDHNRPRSGRGCLPDRRGVGTDRPFRPRKRSHFLPPVTTPPSVTECRRWARRLTQNLACDSRSSMSTTRFERRSRNAFPAASGPNHPLIYPFQPAGAPASTASLTPRRSPFPPWIAGGSRASR